MARAEESSPAHIVVASYGTLGDMNPLLGLACALQGRGHRVTFLGPDVHEPHAVQAGLRFHGIGTRAGYAEAISDPDLWDTRRGFGVIWRSMRPVLRQLPDFVQSQPATRRCVLLVHPLLLPAAALARSRRADTRIVGAYLAPANLRTCHDPLTLGPVRVPRWLPRSLRQWLWRRIDESVIDPVSVPDLNAERKAHGLPPVSHLVAHMHSVADLSITLFPRWFAAHQPDWPSTMHSGDFPLYDPSADTGMTEALEQFLAAGEPPIVFTPGSAHQHASDYFKQALRAVQSLKRRAVFLTSYREQVPDRLPDSVLWQAAAPFRALLPRVSALVHHGGIGTIAEALRAAVPQLVVPLAHDQFDNGSRIQALGVGRILPASRLSARSLARAVREVALSETISSRCRSVAQRFEPAPNDDAICHAIESIR